MVHGTFFPFLWQQPRPNLITYNFISPHGHGQQKRSNAVSGVRYGLRADEPTVLRVQSPLFGVRLSVPTSRTQLNNLYNRLPISLPIDFGIQNVIGTFPFGRGVHYDEPADAYDAKYLRQPIPLPAAQPSDFFLRTPLNPGLLPDKLPRPKVSPNFLIPGNILFRTQSSPPKPFPSPEVPPNFLIPPNILIKAQPPTPPPPRSYTPFNIPYPFNFRML